MLTWNIFLKLPNAKACVVTLKTVFSQPSISLSLGTSPRRVAYGQILIVYDPCMNIKKMTRQCPACCECKPQFHRPERVPLIKATQPFKRININRRGPLPMNNGNKYFLMVVDEYSRFPFVFSCPDVSMKNSREVPYITFFTC